MALTVTTVGAARGTTLTTPTVQHPPQAGGTVLSKRPVLLLLPTVTPFPPAGGDKYGELWVHQPTAEPSDGQAT